MTANTPRTPIKPPEKVVMPPVGGKSPTPKPTPSRSQKSWSLRLMVILGIILGVGFDAYQNLHLPLREDSKINIPRGANVAKVIEVLAEAGVTRNVRQKIYLKFWLNMTGASKWLQAGDYTLPADLPLIDAVKLLNKGKLEQAKITIPEGKNFKQMLEILAKSKDIAHTIQGKDAKAIMAELGKPDAHPEGLFFPDTYFVTAGESDMDILRRAMTLMDDILAKEWDKRTENPYIQTPYQALILASIVERETGVSTEREAVSGVFVRRLKIGMKLQTDPTVIYGMGDAYQGKIRRADLERDTIYNTYTRYGLPPTPIAMPGRAAIHAALHPADGNSLYFVADGSGGHYFSATLAEHEAAVNKYIRGR